MKPLLLIVEDEPSIVAALRVVLEDNFEILSSPSAENALALALKRKIAVVLLDITLEAPERSGVWLLRRLRRLRPATQVIMVTGDKSLHQILECYAFGAYGYIAKPWNNQELIWLIRRAVEKFRLAKKNDFLLARLKKRVPPQMTGTANAPKSDLRNRLISLSRGLYRRRKRALKEVDRAQDELKRQVLLLALRDAGWNQSRAAELLGVKRTTLRQGMASVGIAPPAQFGRPQV